MMGRAAELKRLLGLAVMVVAITATGCMTIELDVNVKPDLAMDVVMKVTAPLEMADQMEGFGELPGMDDVTVEQDATTRTVTGIKRLGPDEDFSAGEEPGPNIIRQKAERRLSTHYVFAMELPADQQPAQPAPPAPDADPQDQQQNQEQLAAMMSGLMSTLKIAVTVRLPGQIVSGNGNRVEADTVTFNLTMHDLTGGQNPKLTVVSKLPNYTRVGMMSDQLIAGGLHFDTAASLPLYLEAGLLPDPPVDAEGHYSLGVDDYGRLAELIATLEQHLPGDMVVPVIGELGLNRDTTDPEQIAKVATAVQTADLQALLQQAVLSALQQ